MKEHLYQKCLRCPWLWGCGLWWCSQWWCWLWGCSTETPADPLDSPREIINNDSWIWLFFFFNPLSHIFLCSIAYCVFFSGCLCSLPPPPTSTCQPLHIPLLSLLTPARCHISPGSVKAARNDITRYILSHLLCPLLPLLPVLSSFLPLYSRCHRCMVSAPSRKSACWPGPVCWGGWTPLLWGRSCWSGRSREPAGRESAGPPSHMGSLRKKLTKNPPKN